MSFSFRGVYNNQGNLIGFDVAKHFLVFMEDELDHFGYRTEYEKLKKSVE